MHAQSELLNIQLNYVLMSCDNARLRREMSVKYLLEIEF